MARPAEPRRTKSRHVRCHATPHRWVFDGDGNLVEFTGRDETRVVVAGGRRVVNPSQAQLETLVGSGSVWELVLPGSWRPAAALRAARRIDAAERSLADYGAYTATVHPATALSRRSVTRVVELRRQSTEWLATAPTTRPSSSKIWSDDPNLVVDELVGFAPSDRAALGIDARRALLTTTLSAARGRSLDWEGGFTTTVTSLWAQPGTARLVSSAVTRCHTRRDVLHMCRYVANLHVTGEFRTEHRSGAALAMLDVAPSWAIEFPDELRLLAAAGAAADPRIGRLDRATLLALVGMVERGWDPSDALDLLERLEHEGVDRAQILAWGVLDDPSSTRGELAEDVAHDDLDSLRRWVTYRNTIGRRDAHQVVAALAAALPASRVMQAAAGLSPQAVRDAVDWADDDLLADSGPYAVAAAAVFAKRLGQWRDKARRLGLSMHDATDFLCEWHTLPASDRGSLGEYLVSHLGRSGRLDGYSDLRTTAALWPHLTPTERRMKPSAVVRKFTAQGYGPISDTTLGQVCAQLRVAPHVAARAAPVWVRGAGQLSWLPVGRKQVGSLTVEFLDRRGGEGLFLGEFTDCCQTIGNVGSSCAVHGQSDAGGGFLVVRDKRARIVAQAWCWLDSTGRGVCFDNVERLSSGNDGARRAAVRDAVTAAADWLVSEGHQQVTIGAAMSGVSLKGWPELDQRLSPAGEGLYTDASRQHRIVGGDGTLRLRVHGEGSLRARFGDGEVHLARHDMVDLRAIRVVGVDDSSDVAAAAAWLAARGAPVVVEDASDTGRALREQLAALGVTDEPESLADTFAGLADNVAGATVDEGADTAHGLVDVSANAAETAARTLGTAAGYDWNVGGEGWEWDDDWDDDYWDDRDHYYGDDDAQWLRRWLSLSQLPVEHPVYDDRDGMDAVFLEADLRDLEPDASWDDDDLLGRHIPHGTLAEQISAGRTNVAAAIEAELPVPRRYTEVVSSLYDPATAAAMRRSHVPLKFAYVLGQSGWGADDVATMWRTHFNNEPTPTWATWVATVAEHNLTPAEIEPWLRGSWGSVSPIEITDLLLAHDDVTASCANHPIGVLADNPTVDVGEVRRARVAGRAQGEVDAWYTQPHPADLPDLGDLLRR